MVEGKEKIQNSLEEFVKSKSTIAIWKTPEGAKQLEEVVSYKKNNPEVSIRTLGEYLKQKCGWNYSSRYIFELIVARLDNENVA